MPVTPGVNGQVMLNVLGKLSERYNNWMNQHQTLDRFLNGPEYINDNSPAYFNLASGPLAVKTTPLSAASRAAREAKRAELARADLVKSNQISLAQYLRRLWNEHGINTKASHRKAMMKAVEINPATVTPPPEGMVKLPYNSGKTIVEGEPLSDWMNINENLIVPQGPNALWRKWEKPLHDATTSFDALGQMPKKGAPAHTLTIEKLGEGLAAMAPYLKEQGGILYAKSGIHIKKENRGKFTKSAKAAGEGVQEHAHKVMNNPNATALQRKRANFAIQAKKWAKKRKKHRLGGKLVSGWALDIIGGENGKED